MKRFLLAMIMIPLCATGQQLKENGNSLKWIKNNLDQISVLRSDPTPPQLDSVYTYTNQPEKLETIEYHKYDEVGRLAQTIQKVVSSDTFSKSEYEYLENRTVETYYSLNNNEWKKTSKFEIDYNEAGKQKETRDYEYENGEWVLIDKIVALEFDENGNFTILIDSIFEGDELQIFKMELAYSADYKTADEKYYVWSEDKSEWIHQQTNQYTFDENFNVIHDTAIEHLDGSDWYKSYEAFYTYDERKNLIEGKEFNWDSDGSEYAFYARMENYYSDNLITANKVITNRTVNIRLEDRNLSIDLGNDSNGQISIVGITGKIYQQNRLEGQVNSISLNGIPSGIYILQINTPSGTQTEKIILP